MRRYSTPSWSQCTDDKLTTLAGGPCAWRVAEVVKRVARNCSDAVCDDAPFLSLDLWMCVSECVCVCVRVCVFELAPPLIVWLSSIHLLGDSPSSSQPTHAHLPEQPWHDC